MTVDEALNATLAEWSDGQRSLDIALTLAHEVRRLRTERDRWQGTAEGLAGSHAALRARVSELEEDLATADAELEQHR